MTENIKNIDRNNYSSPGREVYALHSSEMYIPRSHIEQGVELRLGGEETSSLLVYPVDRLPVDAGGYPMLGGLSISHAIEFVLIDPSIEPSEGNVGLKGLRRGEEVAIGRDSDLMRTRFSGSALLRSPEVSRQHLDIRVDDNGSVIVTDHSTNGTELAVLKDIKESDEMTWDDLAPHTDEPEPKAAGVPEFIDKTPWSKEESSPIVEEQQDPYEVRLRLLSAKPQPQGRDRFGNNLDGRLETTPQSLEDAALAYRFASDEVKEIIQEYTTDDIWRESDMYQLVKDNDELRFKLMQYLVRRLDDMSHHLPERLRHNTEKSINYPGYDKMSSQEAAAVLALEMLGGTYKRTTDEIRISKYGEVIYGQHRWGAMCALGLEGTQYAQEVMTIERGL